MSQVLVARHGVCRSVLWRQGSPSRKISGHLTHLTSILLTTMSGGILGDLPQEAIDLSVSTFRKRLQACIRAEGSHFEHHIINIIHQHHYNHHYHHLHQKRLKKIIIEIKTSLQIHSHSNNCFSEILVITKFILEYFFFSNNRPFTSQL